MSADLEKRLWDAADDLRANSKLKSSEYAIPVLGLIFLWYADHKFAEAEKTMPQSSGRRRIGKTDYQARGVLYIPDKARFARLLDLPEGSDIGIVKANPKLKQATFNRIKSLMFAFFKEAVRRTELKQAKLRDNTSNPVEIIRIAGNHGATETEAYSLNEILSILDTLPEQEQAHVIVAIAGFAGLRRGEIVGLKWSDYTEQADSPTGKFMVNRNVCFGVKGEMIIEEPKTEASKAPVPVIDYLRKILTSYRQTCEKEGRLISDDVWMFPAQYTRKDHNAALLDATKCVPVSPANVLRDSIEPAILDTDIRWKGFHAFRRGIATNLRTLGVDRQTIKEVLRHSDIRVTDRAYIGIVEQKSIDGMQILEDGIAVANAKRRKTTALVQ